MSQVQARGWDKFQKKLWHSFRHELGCIDGVVEETHESDISSSCQVMTRELYELQDPYWRVRYSNWIRKILTTAEMER